MTNVHLNENQKLELSKALFNFGNIIGGAVIINQAVLGALTGGTFIFGLFSFIACFSCAILLLNK